MERQTNPYLCMGLARLIGGILFLAISMPIFYWLKSSNHLAIDYILDIQNIGWPAYKVLGIAFIAGFVGMVIGQGIGASIKIYDDDVASRITIYWHYTINGLIIWLLGANAFLSLSMGYNKELIKLFYFTGGQNFGYWSLLFGALAGFLTVIAMGIGGRKMRYGYSEHSGLFWVKVVPYIVAFLISYIHFQLYDLPGYLVLLNGFIFPHILIFVSAYMWKRDMRMRGLYF